MINVRGYIIFRCAFVSEVIGAVAGFGSSTIFLPLALFFVDFQTALILVAISHLFGNLGRINFFRHGLDKKIIATFGIPSVLFSFLGASVVGILSQDILKVILGIFLIVISVIFLLRPELRLPTNRNTVVTGSSVSGLITGLVGTGGALRATFLTGFNLEIHSNSSSYCFGNRCCKDSFLSKSRTSIATILLLHTYTSRYCNRRFLCWEENSW